MDRLKEKVYCSKCNQETNHGIVLSHKIESSYEFDDFQWYENNQIVQCLGCDNIAFVKEYDDESLRGYDINSFGEAIQVNVGPIYRVYPKKPESKSTLNINLKPKSFEKVPKNLNKLYRDVVTCYNNDAFLLAGTGARMIVEGICSHLGINHGTVTNQDTGEEKRSNRLAGKINGLAEKNYINEDSAKVLHEIRLLGNETAHELNDPSPITIGDVITIIEHMYTIIYEFKGKKLYKRE